MKLTRWFGFRVMSQTGSLEPVCGGKQSRQTITLSVNRQMCWLSDSLLSGDLNAYQSPSPLVFLSSSTPFRRVSFVNFGISNSSLTPCATYIQNKKKRKKTKSFIWTKTVAFFSHKLHHVAMFLLFLMQYVSKHNFACGKLFLGKWHRFP